MQSRTVCEEFERKMWQFMDESLGKEEMLYWEKHVRECALCSCLIMETKEVLSLYGGTAMEDIDEETFNLMVNKAVKKSRFSHLSSRLLDPLYGFSSDGFIKKFAFGGLAFAAVLVVLFFMYKPENMPGVRKYFSRNTDSVPLISRNIAPEKEPAGIAGNPVAGKTEVTPVKYDWNDRKTAYAIHHVGASLARIRVKKADYGSPDDWVLQAIALKRKMEYIKTDLDKSAM